MSGVWKPLYPNEILLKTLKLRLEDGTETKITRTNAKDFFSQHGEILEVTEEM